MEKFTTFTGFAATLDMVNVDTDMIIPKQFLKTIKRTGLGVSLFHEMRYDLDGNEIADFVLNRPAYRNAEILVAGDNFGCGSSREHAPWALKDFGIRCVIAPSFADIFHNNCFKNGILPIVLPEDTVRILMDEAAKGENARLTSLRSRVCCGRSLKIIIGDAFGSSVISSRTVPYAELKVPSSSDASSTSRNRDSAQKSNRSFR